MAETQSDLAQYQTDHDLLVTLNERVKNLIDHVTSVVNANDRLAGDHENRIREIERGQEAQRASSKTWRYIIGISLPVLLMVVSWLYLQFYTVSSTLDSRISKAITTQLTNYSLIKN